MAIEVVTFGCRLNLAESGVMQRRAAEGGLQDALLINTCAVTSEAVRQARQTIRRARREQPGRRIVVTGCAAQTEPATFAAMNEVDLVLGNSDKLSADSYRLPADFGVSGEERVRVNDIMSIRETAAHLVEAVDGRTRAFVQVQNGCDHRCTFCIIPFGRGNSRSVPMGHVVEQIRTLVEQGYKEVVLTGVDITSYGGGLPGTPRLGLLVRSILRNVPDLQRLRLSSINSVEADADLMRAIGEEERLMPHFHLSLQAGDDIILKRMKRRHLRSDAVAFCNAVRKARPDVVFGADLIAGFPTETDAMFANTETLVHECGLTYLHVFPYSARPDTPAARMPQVSRHVAKTRAARLRDMGRQAVAQRLSGEVGRRRSALIENNGIGRTEHFAPVALKGFEPGSIVDVLISGFNSSGLIGRAADGVV